MPAHADGPSQMATGFPYRASLWEAKLASSSTAPAIDRHEGRAAVKPRPSREYLRRLVGAKAPAIAHGGDEEAGRAKPGDRSSGSSSETRANSSNSDADVDLDLTVDMSRPPAVEPRPATPSSPSERPYDDHVDHDPHDLATTVATSFASDHDVQWPAASSSATLSAYESALLPPFSDVASSSTTSVAPDASQLSAFRIYTETKPGVPFPSSDVPDRHLRPLRTRRLESFATSHVAEDELTIYAPPVPTSRALAVSAAMSGSADALSPPPSSSVFSPSNSTAWSNLSPRTVSTAPTEYQIAATPRDFDCPDRSGRSPPVLYSPAFSSPRRSHERLWTASPDLRKPTSPLVDRQGSAPQTPATFGDPSPRSTVLPQFAISTPEGLSFELDSEHDLSIRPAPRPSFLERLEAARSTEAFLVHDPPGEHRGRASSVASFGETNVHATAFQLASPPMGLIEGMVSDWLAWLDSVPPAQVIFVIGFFLGPQCWLLGGWALRGADGEIFGTGSSAGSRVHPTCDGARWVRANRIAASISSVLVTAAVVASCIAVF